MMRWLRRVLSVPYTPRQYRPGEMVKKGGKVPDGAPPPPPRSQDHPPPPPPPPPRAPRPKPRPAQAHDIHIHIHGGQVMTHDEILRLIRMQSRS